MIAVVARSDKHFLRGVDFLHRPRTLLVRFPSRFSPIPYRRTFAEPAC
jgi:hypothetical protein